MIEVFASGGVLASAAQPAAQPARRRTTTVTTTRAAKGNVVAEPAKAGTPNQESAAPRIAKTSTAKKSLHIERNFSDEATKPFDQVEWEQRIAEITDDAGKVIFKQDNVET